jgi:hypothetical protein
MRGFVFASCCLLVLVSCLCCLYLPPVIYERARVLFMLFMRGLVSCLCCLSLPSVVYERARVLFVLFVFASCCL